MPSFKPYQVNLGRATHIQKTLDKIKTDDSTNAHKIDALIALLNINTTQTNENFLKELRDLKKLNPFINELCGTKGFNTIFYNLFRGDDYKAERYRLIIRSIINGEFINHNNQPICYFQNNQLNPPLHEKLQSIKEKYWQISYIKSKLAIGAQEFFKDLLNIKVINNAQNSSPVVVENLNGSHARLLLASIQTGKINFKTIDGLDKLCSLLNYEAALTQKQFKDTPFAEIKKNQTLLDDNKTLLNDILNSCITYKKTNIRLIFMDNIVHGPFNVDKKMEMKLRENLKDQNQDTVIFIKGTNDSYSEYQQNSHTKYKQNIKNKCDPHVALRALYGIFAHCQTLKDLDYRNHEQKYFQNVYYDTCNNKLYLLYKITKTTDGKLMTPYGMVDEVTDINSFVEIMNKKTVEDARIRNCKNWEDHYSAEVVSAAKSYLEAKKATEAAIEKFLSVSPNSSVEFETAFVNRLIADSNFANAKENFQEAVNNNMGTKKLKKYIIIRNNYKNAKTAMLKDSLGNYNPEGTVVSEILDVKIVQCNHTDSEYTTKFQNCTTIRIENGHKNIAV